MKLSEAIRRGIPNVPEHRSSMGCAMCCAFYAVHERQPVSASESRFWWAHGGAAAQHSVPQSLIDEISVRHYRGLTGTGPRFTREQCADYAEKWEREHGLWGMTESQHREKTREVIERISAQPVEA